MKNIVRQNYIDELSQLKDKRIIKVLCGVRRCGKSTIMQMFRDFLIRGGIDGSQTLLMNFEDFENRKFLNDIDGLYNYIMGKLDLSKKNYVFLDEIQNVKEFERLVDGLFVKENIDVYITGSNAYLLSSELGTLLTGRYISIHILPFSFKEFLLTQKDISRTDLLFSQYLTNGSMPGIFELEKENIANYMNDVFESIVQKDVLVRNKWRNSEYFNKTTAFLFDVIGSEISIRKIANTLNSNGAKISHNTIGNYINALTESYLFYKVKRYDLKGNTILSTQEKYYSVDLGFKKSVLGSKANTNLGHNLENIVFLELLRRKKKIYIGKADNTEIDFVATSLGGDTEYIQVAYTAREESTLTRELRPFEKIRDFNKRTLITMDVEPQIDFNGIKKVNVIDWLLE
jgi:predicted AAA+ superfamily ATPase